MSLSIISNANKDVIHEHLLDKGAILFRGVDIDSRDKFQSIVDRISDGQFMEYIDGNSPRTKLSGNVYTSTEFDPEQSITMHSELSYSANWPSKIFFCCTIAAETGGETPLADCREIYKRMDPEAVKKIEDEGLVYIRNLHGGQGIGPSWMDTFETKDKASLEKYFEDTKIQYEWKPDGGVKLIQPSQGIIAHPVTNEKVWFNQIDQFHPSHLDQELYETLMMLYENEEDLPTYVTYGNGEKVPLSLVEEILKVSMDVAVANPWQQGDFVLVDNVLVSHGRKPFTGKREVLVSMVK